MLSCGRLLGAHQRQEALRDDVDPLSGVPSCRYPRCATFRHAAQSAGDTAIKQLHGPTSQPSAALLAKESQDVSAIRKQRGDDAPSGAGRLRC